MRGIRRGGAEQARHQGRGEHGAARLARLAAKHRQAFMGRDACALP
jgi:hypothetical protein